MVSSQGLSFQGSAVLSGLGPFSTRRQYWLFGMGMRWNPQTWRSCNSERPSRSAASARGELQTRS